MIDTESADSPAAGLRALPPRKLRATLILAVSTPLLLTWKYFGSAAFYRAHFGAGVLGLSPSATAEAYRFFGCLLVLGIIPAMVVKLVLRERLSDYGVRMGIRFRTLRSMAIMTPFFILGGYLASLDPAIRAVYPVDPNCGASAGSFALHAAMYLAYYLGWEFHFRGFLQAGLADAAGPANAVLVQTMASCLMHIGDPASEAFSSMIGAVIWGFIALRTRSLLSGTVQHAALGISLDWFILRHGA